MTSTSRRSRWRSARRRTTRWAASGRSRDAGVARQGPLRRRRVRGRHARRQSPRRQLALATCSSSVASRASTRRSTRRTRAATTLDDGADRGAREGSARAVRPRGGREPVRAPRRPQERDADATSASCAPRRTSRRARASSSASRTRRREDRRSTATATTTPAWHEAIDMRNMLIVCEAMARAALARKESRGGHAREDFPEMDKEHFAKVNVVLRARRRAGWRSKKCRCPPCPTRSRRSSRRRNSQRWTASSGEDATLRVFRGDASEGGELKDVRGRDLPGHGRARRHPRHPGEAGADARGALELQGGPLRLVQRRDQRQAAASCA